MTYDEFNNSYKFEERAGFQLSELQKTCVDTFVAWKRSLNRLDMGCGKTAISTVVSLMLESDVTLILVPPILLLPWQRWLNQVSSNILRYQGTPPVRGQLVLRDKRWIVMSHAIFRKDFERILYDLTNLKVDLIVDEAQALKAPTSILYKKVGKFAVGRNLQMLTGTPTSKPLDCYTYIRLTSPDTYRSYAHFLTAHVAKRDFFGAVSEYKNLELLAEHFAQKSLKYTKEEVHGYNNAPLFPDCEYELEPEHMALYNKLLEEQLLLLDDGSKIDATTATRMYHAMQQIIVNYDHFSGDPSKRSNAYDLLDLTIEQTDCLNPNKSKLIIWTYYKLTSRSVLKYLVGKGVKAVGAYSEIDSEKSFEKFMYEKDCRILVAQPSSAGAGLNPQSVCSQALFLEASTSPMHIKQSIARLDRMGQTLKPIIRFGIAQNTIQVPLMRRLLVNDDLVNSVELTKKSLRDALKGLE